MFSLCASYVCYVPGSLLTAWMTGHAFIDLPTPTVPSTSRIHEIIHKSPKMGYGKEKNTPNTTTNIPLHAEVLHQS